MLFDGAEVHGPLDGGFMFRGEFFGERKVEGDLPVKFCFKVFFAGHGQTQAFGADIPGLAKAEGKDVGACGDGGQEKLERFRRCPFATVFCPLVRLNKPAVYYGVYPFPARESHFNSLDHFLLLLSVR